MLPGTHFPSLASLREAAAGQEHRQARTNTVSGTSFPLPPDAQTAATRGAKSIQLHDPLPSHTISSELRQIRTYVEATNARLQYLEALLEPSSVEQVTQIKRGLMGTHRGLERLQKKVSDRSISCTIAEITREAWQAYRRLVALEENLRAMNTTARVGRPRNGHRCAAYVPAGVVEINEESSSTNNTEASNNYGAHRYMMSGALPYEDALPVQDENRAIPPSAQDDSDGLVTMMRNRARMRTRAILSYSDTQRDSMGLDGSCPNVKKIHFACQLLKTRAEVEETIAEEARNSMLDLRDPDRQRDGSTNGFFATYSIMSGLDDPYFNLPKLRFIKIHEVRELKTWLVAHRYLTQSGSISRTEKMLHLLFLLQEGCRLEVVAVWFSRTPREVQAACNEVFDGLLELHSETMLPDEKPVCDHLWGISDKYLTTFGSRKANVGERMYRWPLHDIWKVLITLNLYIGRYRQQGRLSLDGPFQRWWKHFAEVEVNRR